MFSFIFREARNANVIFVVNCERAVLFSVKRDLYPAFTTLNSIDRGWKTKCKYVSRTQICISTERDDPDLLFNVTICFHLKYRQGNIEVEI